MRLRHLRALLVFLAVPHAAPLHTFTGSSSCTAKAPACDNANYAYLQAGAASPDCLHGTQLGCSATPLGRHTWLYLRTMSTTELSLQLTLTGPNLVTNWALWGPFQYPDICGASLGTPVRYGCGVPLSVAQSVPLTVPNHPSGGNYFVLLISTSPSNAALGSPLDSALTIQPASGQTSRLDCTPMQFYAMPLVQAPQPNPRLQLAGVNNVALEGGFVGLVEASQSCAGAAFLQTAATVNGVAQVLFYVGVWDLAAGHLYLVVESCGGECSASC